jgi:hypothetical protein
MKAEDTTDRIASVADAGNNRPKQIGESDRDTGHPSRPNGAWRLIQTALKALLYAAFLCVAVAVLFFGFDRVAKLSLHRSNLAEVYPKDFSLARKDYTRPVSHYDYDFVPGVCIQYDISKGNRYEYANNAVFREPTDISLEKPQDEFRVFFGGGSTAFGLGPTGEAAAAMPSPGIEYRETISHMMEMILNTAAPIPGKKIRVYNTAVWGYAYQHGLLRYLAKLRRYKPDLVISLDGANELPLVSKLSPDWDYFKEGQYNVIIRQIFDYDSPGLLSYLTLWLKNNTFVMTRLWAGRDLFQELGSQMMARAEIIEASQAAANQSGLSVEDMSRLADQNIATVVKVVEDYHSALRNDGVPHLFALQPWFYLSKKTHQENEKKLAGLRGCRQYSGVPSDKMYKLLVDKVAESAARNRYPVVDFSQYFDDVSEWVFTDWCHLTAGANYLIAKELSNLVKEHVLQKPLTGGDRIEDKDTVFWDLAASAKVLYAPPAQAPKYEVSNIFSGYPGEEVYASKVVAPEDKLEVVLDLPRTFLVSRTRIVWADADSVPEEWTVEVSADGENWRPFIQSDNKKTDNLSRWPGFEYYAAEPIEARYVRYRPLKTAQRSIRMRSWALYR